MVDEYVLLIRPLVLRKGRRRFAETGAPAAVHLVDAKVSSNGVVIAAYHQKRG